MFEILSALWRRIDQDSGALTGLSAVVHRFDAGTYTATVLRDDRSVQEARMAVEPPEAAAAGRAGATGPSAGTEPHLDLTQLSSLGAQADQVVQTVLQPAALGYALIHALAGDRGHAVALRAQVDAPTSAVPSGTEFDSRELGPGDVFATVMLRPGRYTIANTLAGSEGTLTVSYPVVTGTPYQPPDPATVECTETGFAPGSLGLQPAQGLIVHIGTRARITITLVTPDDGPPAPPA